MPSKNRLSNLPILVLALAWLVPGAGHVCVGRVWRGVIIFVVISATFWAGVAMGGVMTVDPARERWWFIAEMFVGGHGLVSWQRSRSVIEDIRDDPEWSRPGPTPASVRLDEALKKRGLAVEPLTGTVARAYAGVAGLLNLMCAFDALMLSLMGVQGEPVRDPPAPRGRGEDEGGKGPAT